MEGGIAIPSAVAGRVAGLVVFFFRSSMWCAAIDNYWLR